MRQAALKNKPEMFITVFMFWPSLQRCQIHHHDRSRPHTFCSISCQLHNCSYRRWFWNIVYCINSCKP